MSATTIDIDDERSIGIDFSEGGSLGQHAHELFSHPTVAELFADAVREASPSLFYRHGNDTLSDETVNGMARVFLESGGDMHAFERHLEEDVMDRWSYFENLFKEHFVDSCGWWEPLIENASAVLKTLHPEEDVRGCLEEMRDEMARDTLGDADDSMPLDFLLGWEKVSIIHVPDLSLFGGVEDLHIRYTGSCGDFLSFVPDANLARFLRMVGVSSDAYKAHARFLGRDLEAAPSEAEFGDPSGFRFLDAADRAEAWKTFLVEIDPARRPMLSMDDVVEVLDNASYGGVPVVYFRVGLKDLIGFWSDESNTHLRVRPDGRKGRPQVGIWDFANGSGHVVSADADELVVPRNSGAFLVDDACWGYGIDKSCGFVKSFLEAAVEAIPAPGYRLSKTVGTVRLTERSTYPTPELAVAAGEKWMDSLKAETGSMMDGNEPAGGVPPIRYVVKDIATDAEIAVDACDPVEDVARPSFGG